MIPVLPIDLPHQHDKTWLSHMREDLTMLLTCDCLYALEDWQTSKGAKVEVNLARALGLTVIEQGNVRDVRGEVMPAYEENVDGRV